MTRSQELSFREDYWDDSTAKAAFERFLVAIHGLDLAAWDAAGYWDDHYRPFSYFDAAGEVVSSVCVYSLQMVVSGRRCRAAQISGVGTAAERRRQGLNRRLTEIALEWVAAEHEFVFLFADDEAIPFYDRCGFRPVEEHAPFLEIAAAPCAAAPGVRAMDLDDVDDRRLLWSLASERAPVSEVLGVLSPKLFMFHALYGFRGLLHWVEDLQVAVAMQREGSRLRLLDVVGRRLPAFEQLYPYLATETTREVEFGFVPDALGVSGPTWRPVHGNNLHDRGDLPLRGNRFLFPHTAHA